MIVPDANNPTMPSCLVCAGVLRCAHRFPGLLECRRCGFLTSARQPSDAELHLIYGRHYFHGAEYADYLAEADSLKLNFGRRLATLERYVANIHAKSLFEIGCAYGFFLEIAKTRFRHAAGIDISLDAVVHAREKLGLDARAGNYLEETLHSPIDVFCLWDTIEHLRAPNEYIAKVAREITPGGILAITTGDIGSLNARLRGPRWRMIHAPTHLHYFSTSSLRQILRRHGFEVIHVEHPGQARTLKSILYIILVLRAGRPGLYRIAERFPGLGLSVTLNLFDIMYVIARRLPSSGGVTARPDTRPSSPEGVGRA
jgi:predicted TPR repeat methyltransferase